MTRPERPISVLVIDDSAANRRSIAQVLETAPGVTVVDRAGDGEEGLKKAIALRPDVVTLDLEMPRLDGYSFLRLLMARAPTAVIVLSSYAHPSDVFKALQLGAFDFVAKPANGALESVRSELIEKVRAARYLRREEKPAPKPKPAPRSRAKVSLSEPEPRVVLMGASTGGPPAVQRVLEGLVGLPVCVVVAQHMPARFTTAFAERLDQALPFTVTEARTGDRLKAGRVYIAPGGEQLELVARDGGPTLVVTGAQPEDRHAPSVDRLFASAASVVGAATHAVVLTGMGNDGARGVLALGRAGATVWAEAQSSAVVFGMPEAAIATGEVRHVTPLADLPAQLARALGSKKE